MTVPDGDGRSLPVQWRIATDPDLRRVVGAGTVRTGAERDFTIKVDADGLEPGRTYWYGFAVGGQESPVGRTGTAPTGRLERMRLALVSCSSYPAGHFNVYGRLAEREELDLVVHVGDYIYESASRGSVGRPPEPARELVTLADYRTRYAQYRRDRDLQAAHRAHPWAVVGGVAAVRAHGPRNFEILDSGCCGMAGSFGFESSHHEISLQIGEHKLMPMVRAAAADTLVIPDGFSCKTQVEQMTDRRPLHTAQVLKMAIDHGPQGVSGERPERAYPDIVHDGSGGVRKRLLTAGLAAAAGTAALLAGRRG